MELRNQLLRKKARCKQILKTNKLYNMDCQEGLNQLDNSSIDCCISSPPYWSLRDYGIEPSIWDGDAGCEHEWAEELKFTPNKSAWQIKWTDGRPENASANWKKKVLETMGDSHGNFCSKCGAWYGVLGLEPTFELYIKHLCDIYDQVKRVLKKSGTCWVNLGDTYGGSGNSSGHTSETKNLSRKTLGYGASKGNQKMTRKYAKCLLMLPQRFAIEMVNRGWILRNVIIWHKPNCMPSSARDRFTVDFEYVYFFVKSNKTQYWINEKIGSLVDKKPLGTHGIENSDWEWRECDKCLGTGIKHKKCKFCVETGWYYDEFLRPRKCPKCRGLGRIKMDSECKSCKGKGIKKHNFWRGKQYFFEQQREGLSQNPATQERYKYKVGNQTNRKDDGVEMVKPGKAFSKHFPQDLPRENDFPLLRYNDEYLNLARLDKETRRKAKSNTNSKKHETGIFAGISNESDQNYKDKVRAGILQGKNKRTVWNIPTRSNPESHFATFPPKLVRPMIKAGCPEFICKRCGKPREKIIKKGDLKYDGTGGTTIKKWNQKNDSKIKNMGIPHHYYEKRIIGLTDCNHGSQWKPGIVLDPFAGIGTTLLTAWKLGRNYIGFEISKDYCKIANKGLSETKTMRLDNFIEEKIEV